LHLRVSLMRIALGFLTACVLLTASYGQGRVGEITEPYQLREDFQRDSLGQWASYPPAQDIGYEPSLSPTNNYDAPGGRALMRIVKPNRAGAQRFGFIRKVRLALASDSRLRFSYRLNSPTPFESLEIGLAGTDGRRYITKISPSTNTWVAAEFPLSKFAGAIAGLEVEAVYVVANVAQADADVTYRLIIDNVMFSGVRPATFAFRTPTAELIEPWAALISARSYRAEEKIFMEVSAPTRMVKVDCLLETKNGRQIATKALYDDGTNGDKVARDNIWSNEAVYTLRASDPKGVWRATVNGLTVKGESISTSVRMIVRPDKAGPHPRLFFTATDRQKLIERSRDARLAELWAYLLKQAKSTRDSGEVTHGGQVFEMLDREYLLPSLPGYFDVLNRARFRIAYNSFEAYMTGSDEALKAARTALIDVANWKRWEPPWFRAHGQHTYYPAGLLAADVALGYDLLYNDLSEAEREHIRRALIEKSIIPTFQEYVADNRLMANTSNWLAHTVGGALIAAASIADDLTKTESDKRFDIYVGGLLRKLEDHMAASFLADGSYGEGISYHEFDVETLAPALVALERAFATDYWNETQVLKSLSYPIYTLAQPASLSLDMGDTHAPAGHGIPALVYESREALVRWYYAQFDRPSLSKFIFYDASVEPQPPKLPTSKVFREKGNAVFRSGWGKDDLTFLYRAGPTFNHNHADQGGFLLNAYGESLVSEAGWSDYYKDPHYVTYFIQAIGHNTLLVDGNPESQSIADTAQFAALSSYPRITDVVTSDFHDSLSSELASVYQDRLERFTRRIVFVKPHYFVVFDDLKTNGSPARFDWLLHVPNRRAVETSADLTIYRGKQAALAVRFFTPEQCELEIRPGRIPYHEFAARTPAAVPIEPGYLDFNMGPLKATNFLVALIPARTVEGAKGLADNMTNIKDSTWLGIQTRRGKETDLIMFRASGLSGEARYQQWLTDASSWTVTESSGQPSILSALAASSFKRSGQLFFTSDKPASFAIRFGDDAVTASVSVSESANIRIGTSQAPRSIKLDGHDLALTAATYSATEKATQLHLSAGQHEILLALR
jgi:hypothetical protein